MALQPVVKWRTRVLHSLERERVTDAQYRINDDDPDNSYWSYDEFEDLHLEVSQRLLRESAVRGVALLGSLALKSAVYASGAAIDPAMVKVVGGSIAVGGGGTPLPAALCGITDWYQLQGSAARVFVLMGGNVYFNGTALTLTYIAEPTLDDFQSDALILPAAAMLEIANEWVHQQVTAADWLPIGRA